MKNVLRYKTRQGTKVLMKKAKKNMSQKKVLAERFKAEGVPAFSLRYINSLRTSKEKLFCVHIHSPIFSLNLRLFYQRF